MAVFISGTSYVANPSPLAATEGGTGQSGYTIGDILYASSPTALSKLPIGTNGYVLTVAGGLPTWVASGGGGAPGGADTQIQFNDAGSFGGSSKLTFNKTTGAFIMNVGSVAAPGDVSLSLGNPSGSGVSGGSFAVYGGNHAGGAGSPGNMSLIAGVATAGDVVGGQVILSSGGGFGNGYGGPITVTAGNGGQSSGGDGGNITMNAGNAGSTSTAGGGSLYLLAGNTGNSSTSTTGGNIRLDAGKSNSGSSNGGIISFRTGSVALTERFRISYDGAWGLAGANYGTNGQVLTSNGTGSAPTWAASSGSPGSPTNSVQYNNSGSFAGMNDVVYNGDQSLTFGTGAIGFRLKTNVNAGNSTTLTIQPGDSTAGSPGSLFLYGSSQGTNGQTAGRVEITGGNGVSATAIAGNLYLAGGYTTGSGSAGSATLAGGQSTSGTHGDSILATYHASTSQLRYRLRVDQAGAWYIGATGAYGSGESAGTTGQVLTSNGTSASPTWQEVAGSVAPSSATDTGRAGEIRYDSSWIYVCIATNTWKRSPLSTW